MKNEKKTTGKFVAALVCILLFGGIAIGTTYSIFTNEKKINAHLEISGDLKAKLYLKELVHDVLDENGHITSESVDLATLKDSSGKALVPEEGRGVDLMNYTDKIFDSVKLVPTMEGKAVFLLCNEGDLAFNYILDSKKVAYTTDGKADENASVLSQIKWSVDEPENKQVDKGASAEIVVSYEFLDDEDNNAAQGQMMDFDFTFKIKGVTK